VVEGSGGNGGKAEKREDMEKIMGDWEEKR